MVELNFLHTYYKSLAHTYVVPAPTIDKPWKESKKVGSIVTSRRLLLQMLFIAIPLITIKTESHYKGVRIR